MKNKIREVAQTCYACPSQWEIKLSDGRMIYVRYRWGYLSIRVSPNQTDDIYDAVRGDIVFEEKLGDDLDGVLGEAEMKEYLDIVLKKINNKK